MEDSNLSESGIERLPSRTKLCYALGAISETLMSNIIAVLAMPIYQLALGISPWLLSLALGIPRFWDAVTDPIIASISDNARTRFGRRKPFILLGTLLSAVLCVLLWMPPLGLGEMGLFVYFLTISVLFYTAFTFFVIPYSALGVEMTSDPNDRVRLMTYRSFLMGLAGILFLSWVYKVCIDLGQWILGTDQPGILSRFAWSQTLRVQLYRWMPEGIDKAAPEIAGVRVIGVVIAVLMIVFVIFPLFFTREKYAQVNRDRVPLFRSMTCTFKNKPFALLCISNISTTLGIYMIAPLGMYINLAYIMQMDKGRFAMMAGVYSTVFALLMTAPAPLVSFLGTRYERKKIVMVGLSMILCSYLLSWFTYTPAYPYLQLVHAVLTASGFLCMGVMSYVFIADICDFDELNTGFRREGMYHAIFGWCSKASYAGGTAMAGFIVTWSGFVTTADAQPEQTIFKLRVAFMMVPIIFLAASIYCMSRYPLSKQKMIDIQRHLQQARTARPVSLA